jgi:predicted esterase
VQEHRLVTARRARYYTIGGGGEQPLAESWIVLHGLGQLAAEFITYFRSIATPSRLIVAPEALNRHYVLEKGGRSSDARVGATWMTRQDRDAEIADYVEYLDKVWSEAGGATRVTVVGFSQGVATAARWIAMGKSRVDRFVAWAGQIPPEIDPSVFTKLSDGLTIVSGSKDEFASWIAEGDHLGRLEAVGIKPQVLSFDGGHRMDRQTLDAIAKRSPSEGADSQTAQTS